MAGPGSRRGAAYASLRMREKTVKRILSYMDDMACSLS